MDIVWWDFKALLAGSKSRSYRESMVKITEALIGFLNRYDLVMPREQGNGSSKITDQFTAFFVEHRDGLIVRHLPRTEPVIPPELVIKQSDLADEGELVIKNALDRWLKALDRGNDPGRTVILERELKKIRES